MFLEEWLISKLQHYRVLHAIPGRIRLQIPLWKQIPKELVLESNTMGLAQFLPGIRDIRLNSVTGTVLISYDPQCLTEQEILHTLDEMVNLLLQHRKQLTKFRPEQRDEALAYVQKLAEAHWAWLRMQESAES